MTEEIALRCLERPAPYLKSQVRLKNHENHRLVRDMAWSDLFFSFICYSGLWNILARYAACCQAGEM